MNATRRIVPKMQESHMWKGGTTRIDGVLHRYIPDHPRASKQGYVREHYLIVERRIGRHLTGSEVVVFADGDNTNVKESNLVLLPNRGEASRYIHSMRGNSPVEMKCDACGKIFKRFKSERVYERTFCSAECYHSNGHHTPSDLQRRKLSYAISRRFTTNKEKSVKIPRSDLFCVVCGSCAKHLDNRAEGTFCSDCNDFVETVRYRDSPVFIGVKIKKHIASCNA